MKARLNSIALIAASLIGSAAMLFAATDVSSKEQLGAAQKKWPENGKEIAASLSAANPNWPKQTLESMLEEDLVLTTGLSGRQAEEGFGTTTSSPTIWITSTC